MMNSNKMVYPQMTWAQVTLLQLEQQYGTSPAAKEFIEELIKGRHFLRYDIHMF